MQSWFFARSAERYGKLIHRGVASIGTFDSRENIDQPAGRDRIVDAEPCGR
jgi:hypothetical protein